MSYAYPPAPGAPARRFHRPVLVAVLAIIIGIVGALVLIAGLLLALGLGLVGGAMFGATGALFGAAFGLVVALVGGITLVCAKGLWGMQSWAWWLAIVVVVIGLLASGLYGMIIYGVLFVYLLAVRKHFNQ